MVVCVQCPSRLNSLNHPAVQAWRTHFSRDDEWGPALPRTFAPAKRHQYLSMPSWSSERIVIRNLGPSDMLPVPCCLGQEPSSGSWTACSIPEQAIEEWRDSCAKPQFCHPQARSSPHQYLSHQRAQRTWCEGNKEATVYVVSHRGAVSPRQSSEAQASFTGVAL